MPPMSRVLPALFFAFFPAVALAQTAPPPDTKPARERHRIADKQPPPPQGPWGPEQAGLTWHNPAWRGAFLTAGSYAGSDIGLNVPRGSEATSDGISPPIFEHLEYEDESFRSVAIVGTADLDMIRLSLAWFEGSYKARGTLIRDDGFQTQRTDVHFNGDARGFRVGVYWPTLRYRDAVLEGSLGLAATVGWLHQETKTIPGGTILRRDTLDILTGSLGPKVSLRAMFGRVALEADAEYSFMTGAARGWTRELTVGLGYAF